MVLGMATQQSNQPPPEGEQLAACFLPAAELRHLTAHQPPVAGLSGSRVWLLVNKQSGPRYVLKQLPAAVPPAQIAWTHGLACHLTAAGLKQVPLPLPPLAVAGDEQPIGHFAVDAAGQYWQCLPYLAGEPIADPQPEDVLAAVTCLAELHQAAAGFRTAMPITRQTGWRLRISQLGRLRREGLARPPVGLAGLAGTPLGAWQRLLRVRGEAATCLAPVDFQNLATRLDCRGFPSVVQPVLRDCWWSHVLFDHTMQRRTVSGIIDLDAAGIDTPAVDLARLLGSWQLEAADPSPLLAARWPQAVERYREICQPAGDFPADLQVLHDTAVICGLDRWCHWLFSECRVFPDLDRVTARMEALLRALPAAIDRLQRL